MADRTADAITSAYDAIRAVDRVAFRYGFALKGAQASALAQGLLGAVAGRLGIAPPELGGSLTARGVMELDPPRAMMDFGHFAVLVRDGYEWKGRSGRVLASLPSKPASHANALWLAALAAGAVAATQHEDETGWQRLSATVDLQRARTRAGIDLAVPSATTVDELSQLPAEFWIDDDRRLRRVRFDDGYTQSQVELTRYGSGAGDPPLDWERLPAFESDFP